MTAWVAKPDVGRSRCIPPLGVDDNTYVAAGSRCEVGCARPISAGHGSHRNCYSGPSAVCVSVLMSAPQSEALTRRGGF